MGGIIDFAKKIWNGIISASENIRRVTYNVGRGIVEVAKNVGGVIIRGVRKINEVGRDLINKILEEFELLLFLPLLSLGIEFLSSIIIFGRSNNNSDNQNNNNNNSDNQNNNNNNNNNNDIQNNNNNQENQISLFQVPNVSDFNNENTYQKEQSNIFKNDVSNKVHNIRVNGILNLDDENNDENNEESKTYTFTRDGDENSNAIAFEVYFNSLAIDNNNNFIKLNFTTQHNDADLIRHILERLKQMLINQLHLQIDFTEYDNNNYLPVTVNLNDIQDLSTCQMTITI